MQAAACSSKSDNIFNNMAALAAPESTDLHDELDCYLSSDPEHVVDTVHWWCDHQAEYPHLSRMAIDYLVIPCMPLIHTFISNAHLTLILATSVGVEWTFSKGCLLLSHIRNHLLVQSTCVLMCLGVWSLWGYV
jgi:hAT family C-terminal dimerisation region